MLSWPGSGHALQGCRGPSPFSLNYSDFGSLRGTWQVLVQLIFYHQSGDFYSVSLLGCSGLQGERSPILNGISSIPLIVPPWQNALFLSKSPAEDTVFRHRGESRIGPLARGVRIAGVSSSDPLCSVARNLMMFQGVSPFPACIESAASPHLLHPHAFRVACAKVGFRLH